MSFIENTAKDAFTITPSASEFNVRAQAIYVGGAGDITLTTEAGNSVTFVAVIAGSILPISAVAVTAATATNLLGLIPRELG